jgi:gluconokinase
MNSLSVGIDIGTTHAKAVIISAGGKIIAQHKISYLPKQEEPGYHELDADEVFQAVITVLKKSLEQSHTNNISSVCFSSAMHGLMAVDDEGKPLTGVMTWADTRSKTQSLALKRLDVANELYNATGTPLHPMSPLCKLVWLRENEPQLFNKAAKFISFKEYVIFKLTGRYLVDHSIASATGLFDIHKLQWNKTALQIAGISEEQLAELCAINYTITDIPAYFEELGTINKSLPFIIGGSDGAMANIGSGALVPGLASLTIGTSAAIRMLTATAMIDKKQRLFCYAVDKDSYICGGPLNNGGAVAKWFVENILQKNFETEELYGDFIESVFHNNPSSGLIFIPHLMGERAVQWDPFAKAAFIGITSSHTHEQLLIAIFEGITFALYDILSAIEESGMPVTRILAGGGFTNSPSWLQLVADVFNREISVIDDADVSAKGAAILGFQTTGIIKKYSDIASIDAVAVSYYPRQHKHKKYKSYYEIYKPLYSALKDSFIRLDQLQATSD